MSIPNSPDLSVFNYLLPDEKIAKHPLANRDDSKLLLYQKGQISDKAFREVPKFLASRKRPFSLIIPKSYLPGCIFKKTLVLK